MLILSSGLSGASAAETTTSPANGSTAPDSSAAPTATTAEVTGFRSALFGMSEADVRSAISKDFGVSGAGVRTSQNSAERTQILSIKAADVLPEGGTAEVAYVLGYKTRKLIQVSLSWSKATDDKLTPERLVANGEALRAYFMSAGYKADTLVSNVATRGGLLMFRGEDANGRTTALMLVGAMNDKATTDKTSDKSTRSFAPVALSLFYLADAKNPDVYRIQPGKF
jgi:hypothetical protein